MPEFCRMGRLDLSLFEPFLCRWNQTGAASWTPLLRRLLRSRLDAPVHGDWPTWLAALRQLPELARTQVILSQPCVSVQAEPPLIGPDIERLRAALLELHPWRKGPFCLHGVNIDAEWRSDWKWARVAAALGRLDDAVVLDLGCGNGYYGYRALGAGARLVLGVDPGLRFVAQFLALDRLIRDARLAVMPLCDDDLDGLDAGVDLLLSMGVLYHRRDPGRHLAILRRLLRPDGRLLLETLVIDGCGDSVLKPAGRYAQMRNVYQIPTVSLLLSWLRHAGFPRAELVDLTATTTAEQRGTEWMRFQSLADFLDPKDPTRTREGHPAPLRAMVLAQA